MFYDHIPPDPRLADLYKRRREEWDALVFLEELGIIVLSDPAAASPSHQAKNDEERGRPKAA
jgi:hypothetical protein